MEETKYSYFTCVKCGGQIPFAQGGGKVIGSGKIIATCPKCRHEHSYSPSDVKYAG